MMSEAVQQSLEVLRKGGLILYPTDTVWGVGCDATNVEAVQRVYDLKRSENKTAMIVLCGTLDMAARYISRPPAIAFDVMEVTTKPLTVIMPGGVGVAANLIPEEGTLAIRIPDHEFCTELLRRFGKPIVSTSANISGEATPLSIDGVSETIVTGVDYVVNPKLGKGATGQPSSIMQFDLDGGFKIIRE